ncbi:hypothetical protein BT96DRAFT_983569 [Gymnopus androsaceus JB14]|uniref:F-box domain-containing protein n=1 Tax=Gymnopus androsaceus JB14 TaxID=1447944 RepID=A0A6A4IM02_9AGAR|nr:hypothetical protein BT96DRAFT_983569 [Gymnopus androsaceus JB14]
MSAQLPAEIVEKILQQLWPSYLSPAERILLMTTCPRLNSTWKSQFARIASITIHIPCLSYLLYLAEIIRTGKSLIYDRHGELIATPTGSAFNGSLSKPSSSQASVNCLGKQLQMAHTELSLLFDTTQPPSLKQHKVVINFVIHDPETAQPLDSLLHTGHGGETMLESPWVTVGRWKLGVIDSVYFLIYAELERLPHRPNESHPISDPFAIMEKIKDGLHVHGREIRTSYNTIFHDHDLSEADDFWGISRRLYIAGASTPSWGSFATHLYHRVNEARLRYKCPDILGNYRKVWTHTYHGTLPENDWISFEPLLLTGTWVQEYLKPSEAFGASLSRQTLTLSVESMLLPPSEPRTQ